MALASDGSLSGRIAQVVTCDGGPCGGVAAPAWSPDGGHLAFQRGFPREAGEAYDRVALEVVDLVTGATRVVAVPPVADSEYVEYDGPRWSPDGTQLGFTVMRYPVPPTDENILSSSIAVVKADGSEADAPRILTDPALFASYPDWSRDGERIVFTPTRSAPSRTRRKRPTCTPSDPRDAPHALTTVLNARVGGGSSRPQ